MNKKFTLTPKDLILQQERLAYLEKTSKENIEDLQTSLDTDLKEDFALTALHEKQHQIKQEIDNLRSFLEKAEIISQKNNQNFVELGSMVTYTLLPDKKEKITVELTSKSTS